MRRKRHTWLWIVAAVPVVAALVAFLLFRYVFVVRNVSIGGSRNLSDEDVIRAARLHFGDSIFFVDEEEIREGINALKVLRLDDVELSYPNTVLLNVSQRLPKAMLLYSGEIHVLDSEGCVIESASTVPDTDLIYISGMTVTGFAPGVPVSASEGQTEAYCSVMQALDANGANGYVSEINLKDVNALELITRNGITVQLGNARNMMDKIAYMRSAVSDLVARNENGGSMDVSSGNKADYSGPAGAVVATPAPVQTDAPQG